LKAGVVGLVAGFGNSRRGARVRVGALAVAKSGNTGT